MSDRTKDEKSTNADAALSQPTYCKTDVSRSPYFSEHDALQFGLKCYNDGLYDGQCNLKGGESIVQKFHEFISHNRTPKDMIDNVTPCFKDMKLLLDKYPKAFSLVWSEENGYCLTVDLDVLERLVATADLSL